MDGDRLSLVVLTVYCIDDVCVCATAGSQGAAVNSSKQRLITVGAGKGRAEKLYCICRTSYDQTKSVYIYNFSNLYTENHLCCLYICHSLYCLHLLTSTAPGTRLSVTCTLKTCYLNMNQWIKHKEHKPDACAKKCFSAHSG